MELSSVLIEEMLSWVPAISLLRLKYTCKQWETLITDPRFGKKHWSRMRCREQQFTVFNNVSNPKVSFIGINFDELNKPDLNMQIFRPLSPPHSSIQKMYHCDGLLLFVMTYNLLVLNPFLKQSKWINRGYGFDSFADAYGLGYTSNELSSCNDDYKIVRFRCGVTDGGRSRTEVYEFISDPWKVVVVVVDDDDKNSFNGFLDLPESSVFLRGTPYWLAYIYGKAFATIQSFDFSKERFEPLFLPPSSIGSDKFENSLSLGVFRGDELSLLHKSRATSKIHLWVMKKHWSRLMTVALPECYMCVRYSSYFIENNGKLVLFNRHFESMSTYIVEENQECQKVVSTSMDPLDCGSGCYYVPSLLPVPDVLSLHEI